MKVPRMSRLGVSLCSSCRHRLLHRREIQTAAKQPEIYDIVAVGGGPAGLALVAALKSSPITRHLRIALVESQPASKLLEWHSKPSEYSNRASSLTPSSVAFLKAIRAWKHVNQSRAQPYSDMQVWDGSNGSKIQFDWESETFQSDNSSRIVATMIENLNLSKALLKSIIEADAGDSNQETDRLGSLMFGSTVSSTEYGFDDPEGFDLSSWPVVSVSSPGQKSSTAIAARLLVGADGANSPVRAFAGIDARGWDYSRHGVVATVNIARREEPKLEALQNPESSKATAYQRFLPALGGPIALLPLPDGKASLVWSTTPSNAAYLKSLPVETFAVMVNAAFRLSMTDLAYMFTLPAESVSGTKDYTHAEELSWRLQHTPLPSHLPPLAATIQPSTIASFPLRFRQSNTYTSPRVALIGDAAHTIHPLAGQGLNLGLGDARALFKVIENAVLKGQDLGDAMMVLAAYGQQRWSAGLRVGGTCDLLHKMYSVDSGVFAWGRGLGLGLVDRTPWIKNWIMSQAERS